MSRNLKRGSAARCNGVVRWILIPLAAWAVSGTAAAQVWYLRGGIGWDGTADTRFLDADCAAVSPAALYGCGRGEDGAELQAAGEFEAAGGLELGFGYAVSPAVRLEAVFEYRRGFAFEGRANFLVPDREQSVRTEVSSVSGVLGAQVDLAAWGVPNLGPFRPFMGLGIGRVRHRTGETRMTFPRTETIVPGGSRTDWAWTVTAGLARALGERATLELVWRYMDHGEVGTGEGAGQVQWRDGSRTVPLELAPTRGDIARQGVRLSVRYGF